MIRLRREWVIAALCVLASAATAHAECAWVFCGDVNGPPDYAASPAPTTSLDTRHQCEQLLAREIVSLKRVFANSEAQANDGSTPVSVFLHHCLPDTVDPRGAKGK